MSPLEANGYRFGIVIIAFGISRQLFSMGAYRGDLTVTFGAAIAALAILNSTIGAVTSTDNDETEMD
ncbi:hypothetical protein [Haloprofundus salinisoli]|uniref:hypothetical protein n=1 Tax=Haloprofundus salinisoli TaxID=2876193 RepID=UPI001CCFAE18|nr:hypothetical protein [Haloprofundus salinisoli]